MHASSAYTIARPRGGEREVRRLLRGLHRPYILQAEPMARMLCDIYDLGKPQDAVIRLVREALPAEAGSAAAHLRELIERCDIGGDTQLGTAQEMNISMRQFFRYRSEAVKALARHVNALVGGNPEQPTPLVEVARLLAEVDPPAAATIYNFFPRSHEITSKRIETALSAGDTIDDALLESCISTERPLAFFAVARFLYEHGCRSEGSAVREWTLGLLRDVHLTNRAELEFQARLCEYAEAALYADADSAEQCARNVREAAAQDEWMNCTAILLEIEAAIRVGQIDRAAETYEIAKSSILPLQNLRLLGGLLYCEASIAFMRGDLEGAEAALRGAIQALRHRAYDSLALEAFSGRIKLQLGRPWSAPAIMVLDRPVADIVLSLGTSQRIELSGRSARCFPQLQLEVMKLRADLLRKAEIDRAGLENYLARADASGYPSLLASGLALAANVQERGREEAAAQAFYCRAWAIYADMCDEFLGRDLFILDATPARDLGPLKADDPFLRVFNEMFERRFPGSAFVRLQGRAESGAFWRAAIRVAYLQCGHETLKDAELKLLDHLTSHRPPEPMRHRVPIIAEIPMRLSVFLPLPMRPAFIESLSKNLDHFYDLLGRRF